MLEFETITRKWGNSLGVTLPKETVEEGSIKEHDKIRILILKQNNVLKRTFGMAKSKWNKSAQEIKNEIRSELHNA